MLRRAEAPTTAVTEPRSLVPASGQVPALVWPAGAMWVVAASVVALPETGGWIAVGCAFATVCVVLVATGGLCRVVRGSTRPSERTRHLWMTVAVSLLCTGLVSAAIAVHAPARQPAVVDVLVGAGDDSRPAAERPATGGHRLMFDVLVTGDPVRTSAGSSRGLPGERLRFAGRWESATMPERTGRTGGTRAQGGAGEPNTQQSDGSVHGLGVPILVFASGAVAPSIGERWRFEGTLRWNPPEDTSAAIVFARSEPTRIDVAHGGIDWAAGLRSGFAEVAASLPGDGGALLPGLSIGDTSRVGPDLDAAMKASSLSHLTAVSGANCAVIVLLVLGCAARCRLPRAARTIAALVALGAFVLLVTPQPSVQRAAVMAGIVLVAGGLGRPARGLAALALAVVLLLTMDPWLSRDIGFALSVLATLGLIVLARPLAAVLSRCMPTSLAMLIAIPLAAQLACQPVLLLLDPAIPIGGVPANLLAAPAAAPATVVGLASCLMSAVWPQLGIVIAWIAWLPAAWIAAIARWFAAWEHARLPWIPGAWGVLVLAAATVALALLIVFRRTLPRAAMIGCIGLLVCVLAGSAGRLVGDTVTTALTRPADWIIAACDVGQGDAVLVRDSSGQIALVDVGPDPEPLDDCLRELGVDRIDLLVLTHYDADHVGGLAAVLGSVGTAIVGPTADAADDRLLESLRAQGAEVVQGRAGLAGRLGGVGWSVLWPAESRSMRDAEPETGNDASIVVRFDSGVFGDRETVDEAAAWSAMFLGDLGEDAQNRLLARHSLGSEIDVVKVAHHGSGDQSDRLYERLGASIGILSVGADNGYGHPTDSLLALLELTGVVPLRTDHSGLLLLSVTANADRALEADDGHDRAGRFSVWSERAPPAP
ncbi:ComEC/Rec2 family competence protein [Plantibacter sp. Mn2098]|uniref:ComEC/Rec2 family competence protein n=1 Tax=Plantibacter sp. Mn2098 TaxID=3395266 RepID=UPI003BC8D566